MQVRAMELSELDDVVGIHMMGLEAELVLFNKILDLKSVNDQGRDHLKKILYQMIQTTEAHIVVAKAPTEFAGYCLVTKKLYPVENPKLSGCINGIYVKEAYRRQNLGRQMYEQAEQWLKDEGVTLIELYHMINDPRAEAFWKTSGFVPVQYNCIKSL